MDVHDAITAARLPERSVALCLRGDLVAEFEALDRRLEQLPGRGDALNSSAEYLQVARDIETVRQDMAAASVEFRLRALPRRRWNQLLLDHPPRVDSDTDKAVGINEATFYDALIAESIVDPSLSPGELTRLLDDVLTSAQYDEISRAAWTLNRKGVDVPFSRAASRILAMTSGSA